MAFIFADVNFSVKLYGEKARASFSIYFHGTDELRPFRQCNVVPTFAMATASLQINATICKAHVSEKRFYKARRAFDMLFPTKFLHY